MKERSVAEERRTFKGYMMERAYEEGTFLDVYVTPHLWQIAEQVFDGDQVRESTWSMRRWNRDRTRTMGLGMMAAGRSHLMVVEAVRKITPDTIREFLDQFSELPEFFPEYASHQLVPVIASIYISPDAIQVLNRQKVYGVAMGDETMQIVNLGQF